MAATETPPGADTEAAAGADADPGAGEQEAPEVEDHHPTPRRYVEVAVVLAVLTGLEVTASFVDVGPLFLPSLIVLMVLKFLLVAGWFMHLRFDTALYSRLFGGGLAVALSIYAVVLANMYLHFVGA